MPSSACRLPRAPLVTSFPYTTLFRSVGDWVEEGRRPAQQLVTTRSVDRAHVANELVVEGRPHFALEPLGAGPGHDQGDLQLAGNAPRDRKSTRLNSSHTVTSYAVFCL